MSTPSGGLEANPKATHLGQKARFIGVKRLVLICASLGAGAALGVMAIVLFAGWYLNRPTPPKDWPTLDIRSIGVKAKLKTDWNGSVRYQLQVSPASHDLLESFDKIAQSHLPLIPFTIHFYDKSGFELCKSEVSPKAQFNAENRVSALIANEHFHCSRSDYQNSSRWNLSYTLPKLSVDSSPKQMVTASISGQGDASPSTKNLAEHSKAGLLEGDDTLTGFDDSRGWLETKGRKTFRIYRAGEKDTASMWNKIAVLGGKQPRLHFDCKGGPDCLIENLDNKQAVHGKLLKQPY